MSDTTPGLRARIEVLEEENRQLRKLLIPDPLFCRSLQLSPSEDKLLRILSSRQGTVRYETIEDILWLCEGHERQPATIKVMMFNLRKKLARHGIRIETHWGFGYFMTPENRAHARACLQRPAMELAA